MLHNGIANAPPQRPRGGATQLEANGLAQSSLFRQSGGARSRGDSRGHCVFTADPQTQHRSSPGGCCSSHVRATRPARGEETTPAVSPSTPQCAASGSEQPARPEIQAPGSRVGPPTGLPGPGQLCPTSGSGPSAGRTLTAGLRQGLPGTSQLCPLWGRVGALAGPALLDATLAPPSAGPSPDSAAAAGDAAAVCTFPEAERLTQSQHVTSSPQLEVCRLQLAALHPLLCHPDQGRARGRAAGTGCSGTRVGPQAARGPVGGRNTDRVSENEQPAGWGGTGLEWVSGRQLPGPGARRGSIRVFSLKPTHQHDAGGRDPADGTGG